MPLTVRDYLVSLVRTAVPVVVGLVLAQLAKLGVEIDDAAVETVVSGLFIGGYYSVVRALEARFPAAGVLLGYKSEPHYEGG